MITKEIIKNKINEIGFKEAIEYFKNDIKYINEKLFGNIDFGSVKEMFHCIHYDYNPICINGNKRNFDIKRSKHGSYSKFSCYLKKTNQCLCWNNHNNWDYISDDKKKEIINKRNKTNLAKYGNKTPSKNTLIANKTGETLKKNFKDKEWKNKVISKRKNTLKEKGITFKQITEKMNETNLKKYGFSSITKSTEYQKEKKELYLNGSSKHNPHLTVEIKQILNNKDKFIEFAKDKKPLEITELLGVTNSLIYKLIKKYDCKNILCQDRKISVAHKELLNFLKNNNIDFVVNDWSILENKELDIYIPKFKLAIEYNGIYWHSIAKDANPNKHLEKYILCKEKGIALIQIFENKWRFSKNTKELIKKILINYFSGLDTIELLVKAKYLEIKNNQYILSNDFPILNNSFSQVAKVKPKLFNSRNNQIWSSGQTIYIKNPRK